LIRRLISNRTVEPGRGIAWIQGLRHIELNPGQLIAFVRILGVVGLTKVTAQQGLRRIQNDRSFQVRPSGREIVLFDPR
jgi:hypothetical protein